MTIIIDEIGHQLRMTLEHLLRPIKAHDHKRGGIGIGHHTALGQDRGREDVMLYGIARMRINGMGITLVALIVEITVVATGGHRHIRDIQGGLQLMPHTQRVLRGLGHPDAPGHPLGVDTLSNHLTANLHHEVLTTSVP